MIYNIGDKVILREGLGTSERYIYFSLPGEYLVFQEGMEHLQKSLHRIDRVDELGEGKAYVIDGWYVASAMIDDEKTAELTDKKIKIGDTVMTLSESEFETIGKGVLGKVENMTNMSYGVRVRHGDRICFFRQEDLKRANDSPGSQRELPEIPGYIARFIREKNWKKLDLWTVFYNCRVSEDRAYNWIRQNDILFAKAWIYGYTIKDEVKYRARLKIIGENIASYLRTQSASNRLENLEIGSKYISGDYQELSEFSEEELGELGLFDNPDWEIERVVENERD